MNQRYGIQAKMIPTTHTIHSTSVPTASTTATATAINSSNIYTNASSKKGVHINIGTGPGLSSKRQVTISSRHNSSKGSIKDTTRITINRSPSPDERDVIAENKNKGSSKKEL